MTPHQLADVLAWCAGMGYAILLVWAFAWLAIPGAIYRLHSHWFRLERSTYDALMFVMIGLFKLALLVLFVFPLIALYATGLAGGGA
ncbi:DUF6868 family protein [Lysobacter claricitrinus]|uniref:DUF6868 family protein n=1 Tax=Lysobacter claricitrinus TaxID=3367728 RepID=UPI0037DBD682